jgi:hypothetical protein
MQRRDKMRINKSVFAAVGIAAALAVAPAMAANDPNFGQVMSSIQAVKTSPTQIQGLKTVKSVNVVKVNDLAKGENMKALDEAVTKNQSDITSLRTAMTSNTAVKTALTNANVDVSKVVATEIGSDGILTVYVR